MVKKYKLKVKEPLPKRREIKLDDIIKKIKNNKLPESWSLYIFLFFIILWAIIGHENSGHLSSLRWLLWYLISYSFFLFTLWFSYSYAISKIFKVNLEGVMKKDIIALLPLILLFFGLKEVAIIISIALKLFLLPSKKKKCSDLYKGILRKDSCDKPRFMIKAFLIFIFVSVIILYPIFINFSYLGVHDWDFFEFRNGAQRKTIIEYGQFPLWNPYYCGGDTMLANPLSGFLSPFFLLVLLFGAVYGLKLSLSFYLIFGMAGMYYLSRYMMISRAGSFLSAFIFMLNGFFIAHVAVGHTVFLSIAYFPWVFFFYLKSHKDIKYIIPSSIFFTLIFLEGGIYPFTYLALFLTLFSLLETVRNRSFIFLRNALIIFLIIVFIGSIKLIPLVELTMNDEHVKYGPGEGFTTDIFVNSLINFRLNDLHFDEILFSGQPFLWHEYYSYIGIVSLFLAIVGAFIISRRLWPLVIACITFLVLSYGTNSYFNLWGILKAIPFFGFLGVPTRAMMIVLFCFAIFAGFSLSKLEKMKIPKFIIYIILLSVLAELIIVNSQCLENKFTIAPIDYEPSMTFYQKTENNFTEKIPGSNLRNSTIISKMYPNLLMNIGTINCYGKNHLPVSAKPVQDEDYKGEAYYLKSNQPAKIVHFSPNRIILQIDIIKPDVLIINQNYYKGWYMKGRKVFPYSGLISAKVYPSDDIVELYYMPNSFLIGLFISVLGLVFSGKFYFNKNFRKKVGMSIKYLVKVINLRLQYIFKSRKNGKKNKD